MVERIITWTMFSAGTVAVVGFVLVALGVTVWSGLYSVVWPAAGWMIVLGIVIGGLAGAASLLERYSPTK